MTLVAVEDRLAQAWHEFDQKAQQQEQSYEAQARAQLASEAIAVVRMLERNVPSFKAEDEPPPTLLWPYLEVAFLAITAAYSTAAGAFYRQWYNRFRPLFAKTMAGNTTASQVAINQRTTLLAQRVTQTTQQRIAEVVAQARAENIGMRELTRRIRSDVFGDTITQARATMIARTETVGALNEAAWIRARQSGVNRSKRWVSQRVGDFRKRHDAEEKAGWVPIDAPYPITGKMYPHDSIGGAAENANCRCSQIFTDQTADEANGGGA